MKHIIPCHEYQWLLQLSVVVSQSLSNLYMLQNEVLCARSVDRVKLNHLYNTGFNASPNPI